MRFIVRQVAKRADGGDIIRTRTLVQAELSIGRGTDCDLQLADLAVMLRHARLTQTGPGRVSLDAVGGVPVAVAGKFVTRADLVLADSPAVEIGPFRLTRFAVRVPDRIDDSGRGTAIPEAGEEDPSEVVVTGKTAGKPAYGLTLPASALNACVSLSFDKPAKQIELVCRSPVAD